jgi:3-methylcrotonyl-CoA carboxylase alpha subunit
VAGTKSNIAFLERLVRHPAVLEGTIDTGYLDRHLDQFLAGDAPPSPAALFAAATAVLIDQERDAREAARSGTDPHSPWAVADGWCIGNAGKRIVALGSRGQRFEIDARGNHGDYDLQHDDARCAVRHARIDGEWLNGRFDGQTWRVRSAIDPAQVRVHVDGNAREAFIRTAAFAFETQSDEGGDRVTAPMPGRIVLVKARDGDEVQKDQELLVMEAMKMELTLRSPRAGTIESVGVASGDFVEADAVLVRLARSEST